MFRKQHGRISPRGIIQFLMLDREFPRSAKFCLQSARDSLHLITGTEQSLFRNAPEKLLGRLCSELEFATVDDIVGQGLHEYIDQFQTNLNKSARAISESFFAFTPTPRPTAISSSTIGLLTNS